MSFMHNITFRFTLWYLAILAILLTLLGSGVYFTLSGVLYGNLDDSLQTRGKQLLEFENIISIVAGGTFEEEIGEFISFYYYADDKLMHISHKQSRVSVSRKKIDLAMSGKSSFSSVEVSPGANRRAYIAPFKQKDSDTGQKRSAERKKSVMKQMQTRMAGFLWMK